MPAWCQAQEQSWRLRASSMSTARTASRNLRPRPNPRHPSNRPPCPRRHHRRHRPRCQHHRLRQHRLLRQHLRPLNRSRPLRNRWPHPYLHFPAPILRNHPSPKQPRRLWLMQRQRNPMRIRRRLSERRSTLKTVPLPFEPRSTPTTAPPHRPEPRLTPRNRLHLRFKRPWRQPTTRSNQPRSQTVRPRSGCRPPKPHRPRQLHRARQPHRPHCRRWTFRHPLRRAIQQTRLSHRRPCLPTWCHPFRLRRPSTLPQLMPRRPSIHPHRR